jgi:hypothetical protein
MKGGSRMFSPLVLRHQSFCGKTQLVQKIQNAIAKCKLSSLCVRLAGIVLEE